VSGTEGIRAIDAPERSERQRQLIDDAALLAEDVSDASQLIGYTILAFYSDGATRTAGYRPNTGEHRIGGTMYEAWARATLESHFAYGEGVSAAYDVLEGRS
jgi:hypothetical protein